MGLRRQDGEALRVGLFAQREQCRTKALGGASERTLLSTEVVSSVLLATFESYDAGTDLREEQTNFAGGCLG
jgi:hypothetical protein